MGYNNFVIVLAKGLSLYKHVSFLSQTPLSSRLPPNTEQISLCYTVGPCWRNPTLWTFSTSRRGTSFVLRRQFLFWNRNCFMPYFLLYYASNYNLNTAWPGVEQGGAEKMWNEPGNDNREWWNLNRWGCSELEVDESTHPAPTRAGNSSSTCWVTHCLFTFKKVPVMLLRMDWRVIKQGWWNIVLFWADMKLWRKVFDASGRKLV